MYYYKDQHGKKYGRLTVLHVSGRDNRGNVIWKCKCDCGNISKVRSSSLNAGKTKSCGCIAREKARANHTHHLSESRIYGIFYNMKSRCESPKSPSFYVYGAKGIRVEWPNFQSFADEMYESYVSHVQKFGEKNTQIDRIDNSKNYSFENCRWATLVEQSRNSSNCNFVTYKGERLCIAEWAKRIGLSRSALYTRIYVRKIPLEIALTTPPVAPNRRNNPYLLP